MQEDNAVTIKPAMGMFLLSLRGSSGVDVSQMEKTFPYALEAFRRGWIEASEAREQTAPTAADVQTLLTQYHKALAGLYEAYRFGAMLLRLKLALEGETAENTPESAPENASESGSELDPPQSPENQDFPCVLTRENAGKVIVGRGGNKVAVQAGLECGAGASGVGFFLQRLIYSGKKVHRYDHRYDEQADQFRDTHLHFSFDCGLLRGEQGRSSPGEVRD